jgi:hypothetical protein
LRKSIVFTQVGILSLASVLAHADLQSDTIAQAKKVFADAQAVSDKESGHLWSRKLYGRMLLVDPQTRAVVANEPDPQGVLHATDGVYVGTLPASLIISNAPTEWEGLRWTMLMWFTIPDDGTSRRITFAHELFHQMQSDLHLVAQDNPALHLDTTEGRVWLQLEWRALAAALIESGAAQTVAIRDALAFRAYRHAQFPHSGEIEAGQEIAEGIPEYTGVVAGEPDIYAARWHAAAQLAHPDVSISFVRSFAYTSGPGYGLLLDECLPGWRTKLSTQTDLAELLGSTLKGNVAVSAQARARYYGASEIQIAEADRAAKADAEKARYRAQLIDGPTLVVPKLGQFSFNPTTLISLDDAGTVYPTLHAVSGWGTLDVKDGVLVPRDRSGAILAAPKDTNGPHLQGPGWTIDLASGWSVVPGPKPGNYVLRQ